MQVELLDLKEMAINLHDRYQAGLLSLEEYLDFMIQIDEAIDKIEMQYSICYSRENKSE